MNKSTRNIIIFAAVTLGCGFLGNAINNLYRPQDPMQSLGVLIWLVSPLAANLLLRWLGKDGWQDLGIGPHLKSGWRWYLVALLIIPLVSVIMIALGAIIGVTSPVFSAQAISAFTSILGVAFAGNMVKNLFEEFAWRGYLTPRLEALHAGPFVSSLATGLIWASWHIPYYLFFLSPAVLKGQTSLSAPVLILTAFFLLPLQSFVYGELRLLSKSVWVTWLLHTVANALAFALATSGLALIAGSLSSVFFAPSTDGIVYSLLLVLAGWGLHQYRTQSTRVVNNRL